MFSGSEVEDSPLYTPVFPTSPALHGLSSCGMQMLPLPGPPSSVDESFESVMAVNDNQNSPAPLGASSGDYVYTDSSSNVQQQFSFADVDLYHASLDLTAPFTDWACGAPTEPYPPAVVGASGCFGPPPLPIPFTLQHTTSAFDETPAALWGASYPLALAASESAMFDGTFTAAFPEVLATGYDVAATQAGLDEFINVL